MNKRLVVSYTVSFALIALVALVVLKSNPQPNLDGKNQIQPVAVTQAPPHVQTTPTPKTQNTHSANQWTAGHKSPSWQRAGGIWDWNWPEEKDFQKVWRSWGNGTGTYTVVMARALKDSKAGEQIWLLAKSSDGKVFMQNIPWPNSHGGGLLGRLSVPLDSLKPGPFQLIRDDETISFQASRIFRGNEWHAGAFDDWVYTTTMLTFEPPAKQAARPRAGNNSEQEEKTLWRTAKEAMKAGPNEGADAIEQLIGQVSSYDSRWQFALEFAQKHKLPKLQMKIYSIFRPVGRCSMDTRPQDMAREHADLCKSEGSLGCYLQLSVNIMADNFTRRAYSSYGEKHHNTQSKILDTTGLDSERFLRGLLIAYPSQLQIPVSIGLWRLSRAIRELAGDDGASLITKVATDTRLDEANRLRATIALAYFYMGAEESKTKTAQILSQLDLSPTSRLWVEKFKTVKD